MKEEGEEGGGGRWRKLKNPEGKFWKILPTRGRGVGEEGLETHLGYVLGSRNLR